MEFIFDMQIGYYKNSGDCAKDALEFIKAMKKSILHLSL
jgi:hypothetical protein